MADALSGRELFCRKHREKQIRHGVLHLYLRRSGWWQQRRVRDSRVARRLYLESLGAKPVAPLTYVLRLTTYVPTSYVDMMARCKQFVIRFLRLGPQPHSVEYLDQLAAATNLNRKESGESSFS